MSIGRSVGVLVGDGSAVRVAVGNGARVLLGRVGVTVTNLGVLETNREVSVNWGVSVGVIVDVGIKPVTACIVKAETVLRFETAKSTMFFGSISTLVGALGLSNANTEIIHSRTIPRVPDARTPRGPEYSLILPLVAA